MLRVAKRLPARRLLCQFGVIADIQYADTNDAFNFAQDRKRRYRNALAVTKRAVDWWNTQDLDFISHLGDIIDGCNHRLKQSESAMQEVLTEFERCRCKKQLYSVGNHELYNFTKAELARFFKTESDYFHFSPCAGLRIVQLDSMHTCIMMPEGSPEHKEAKAILLRENPACLKGAHDWFQGKHGAEQRFVPYNAALGKAQLAWLDQVLNDAHEAQEKVIIFAHIPFYRKAASWRTVAWDFPEALAIIQKRQCVVACMHGHEHDGGYAKDEVGIHHIVLPSVLEVPDDLDSFGTVAVYEDRLEIIGKGLVKSKVYPFPAWALAHIADASVADSALAAAGASKAPHSPVEVSPSTPHDDSSVDNGSPKL